MLICRDVILSLLLMLCVAGCNPKRGSASSPRDQSDTTTGDLFTEIQDSVLGNWVISDNIQGPYGETLAYLISPNLLVKNVALRVISTVVFDPGEGSLGATFGTIVGSGSEETVSFRVPSISIRPTKAWRDVSSTEEIVVQFN